MSQPAAPASAPASSQPAPASTPASSQPAPTSAPPASMPAQAAADTQAADPLASQQSSAGEMLPMPAFAGLSTAMPALRASIAAADPNRMAAGHAEQPKGIHPLALDEARQLHTRLLTEPLQHSADDAPNREMQLVQLAPAHGGYTLNCNVAHTGSIKTMTMRASNSTEAKAQGRTAATADLQTLSAGAALGNVGASTEVGASRSKADSKEWQLEFITVPTAAFTIKREQLQLQPERLKEAGRIDTVQKAASFLDEYVSHVHYGDFTLGGYCSYVAELQQSDDRTHMHESASVTYNEASETKPAEPPAAKASSQTADPAASTAAKQLAGQQATSLIGLGTFRASHGISHSKQSNKVATSAEYDFFGADRCNASVFEPTVFSSQHRWGCLLHKTRQVPVWQLLIDAAAELPATAASDSHALQRAAGYLHLAWLAQQPQKPAAARASKISVSWGKKFLPRRQEAGLQLQPPAADGGVTPAQWAEAVVYVAKLGRSEHHDGYQPLTELVLHCDSLGATAAAALLQVASQIGLPSGAADEALRTLLSCAGTHESIELLNQLPGDACKRQLVALQRRLRNAAHHEAAHHEAAKTLLKKVNSILGGLQLVKGKGLWLSSKSRLSMRGS